MTADPSSVALVLTVLLLACTVQSAFGFGLALVAVPLLATRLPLSLVTPLLALISLTLGAGIAWRSRGAIRLDLWWRLLASAALGVPFGIALVVVLDGNAVRLALGGVVFLAGVRGLLEERASATAPGAPSTRLAAAGSVSWAVWPFGFVTGVLGGAWNLMGPPLVLFLTWSRLDPTTFRATLHAFAFAINVVVVLGWSASGTADGGDAVRRLVSWYLLSLAPLLGGGWLGGRIAARADLRRYRSAVHALLLVSGATLVLSASG